MVEHDLFATIADRRSIKRFSSRPVETDKILQILQAGHLAPSAGNLQNWRFIVVTDVETIRSLYHHTLDQEPFLSAMCAIVVVGDVELAHKMYGMRGKRLYTVQNCAAAIQNILLTAHAFELGAVWIGAFDEDKVAAVFGIPVHEYRPQAIILIGYPDTEAEAKHSKPLQDVVYFNQFGNKVVRPHLIFYDWATEWRNLAKKIRTHAQHAQDYTRDIVKEKVVKEENSLAKTKEHIRQAIDKLKREQYRK
jgi:nitroreductase